MLYIQEKLENNRALTLSTIKSNKFKSGVITFSMTLPMTKNAVAYNLVLSGLLRRGTKNYPSMSALNRALDDLYGSYVEIRSSHLGENLSLIISAEILDNKYVPEKTDILGGVVDIISELIIEPLIKSPSFDRNAFVQEQKVVLDGINSLKNNTRSYSIKRCAELMGENISNYPTYDELRGIIENITFEDTLAYYRDLIKVAPLDIFYIGSAEPSVIKKKIASFVENYPCKSTQKVVSLSPYKRNEPIELTEKMSVSQGKLALGFSTGVHLSPTDERYYTALMLNEIFGGSVSSKLFLNVRERMGLCYYCSSTFSIYTGIIMVSSGIEVSKREIVKQAILDQLGEIARKNVSKEELEAARRSIANSYRQLYDTPFDIQTFYSGRCLFGVKDTIDDCEKKLMQVSLDEIAKLASSVTLDATFFVEGTLEEGLGEEYEND